MKADLKTLEKELPAIIARREISKLLGGIISSQTLANYDCQGKGPKSLKIGKHVTYRREDLLEWLSDRIEEEK